jgi:hypothetical protein
LFSSPSRSKECFASAALKAAGNRDYTLVVIPKANHGMLEAKVGSTAEVKSLQRFAPAYFTKIEDWLATRRVHGIGSPRTPPRDATNDSLTSFSTFRDDLGTAPTVAKTARRPTDLLVVAGDHRYYATRRELAAKGAAAEIARSLGASPGSPPGQSSHYKLLENFGVAIRATSFAA